MKEKQSKLKYLTKDRYSFGVSLIIFAVMLSYVGLSQLPTQFLLISLIENEYEGVLTVGFEEMSFKCNRSTEKWWISFESDFELPEDNFDQKKIEENFYYRAWDVKVIGVVSAKTDWGYGHLDQYPREITIYSVKEAQEKWPLKDNTEPVAGGDHTR